MPVPTGVAIVALALGIGGVTLVFSVVAALLLAPLPYTHPERLVVIQPTSSWELFELWRAASTACVTVSAYTERAMNLTGDGEPERVVVGRITPDFLSVTGAIAARGRVFSSEDFAAGGGYSALITDAFWRRRFGGALDAVGRTVTLDDRLYTIVGILHPDFRSPPELPSARAQTIEQGARLLVPLLGDPHRRSPETTDRASRPLYALARLKTGIGIDRARAELTTIVQRLQRRPTTTTFSLLTLTDYVAGDVPKQMAILMVAVALLLFVACANVANVVLSRASSRSGEMALRVALGASGRQLARQVLNECLVLGAVSGALGAALAWIGSRVIASLGGTVLSGLEGVSLDGSVLTFAIVVSIGSSLAVSILPSLHVSKADPGEALKTARAATPGSSRVRSVLVVAEVALTLVVLLAAGLLGSDFARLSRVDLGFTPAGVLTADVSLNPTRYQTGAARALFFHELLRRLAALPGVDSVGMAMNGPLSTSGANVRVDSASAPASSSDAESFEFCEAVGGRYFRTLSMPVRAGRAIDETDTASAPGVIVGSDALARKYWGTPTAALGRTVHFGGRTFTVVGVVPDRIRLGSSLPPAPLVYFAYDQFPAPVAQMTLLAHAAGDGSLSAADIRHGVRDVDPNQSVYNIGPLERVVRAPLMRRQLLLVMTGLFGSFTLLVAAVGVYGALSCWVVERRHEMGVRLAVGGRPRSVFALTIARGLKLVVLGIAVGAPLAFCVMSVFASQLVAVTRADAPTWMICAAVVTVVGLAGCLVPALSAMRVDPIDIVRAE